MNDAITTKRCPPRMLCGSTSSQPLYTSGLRITTNPIDYRPYRLRRPSKGQKTSKPRKSSTVDDLVFISAQLPELSRPRRPHPTAHRAVVLSTQGRLPNKAGQNLADEPIAFLTLGDRPGRRRNLLGWA
jgi:hypothetical protein